MINQYFSLSLKLINFFLIRKLRLREVTSLPFPKVTVIRKFFLKELLSTNCYLKCEYIYPQIPFFALRVAP